MSMDTSNNLKCAVEDCNLIARTLFKSPKDPTILKKWQKLLRTCEEKFLVCENHFEDKYVKKLKLSLIDEAIPTLFINDSRTVENDICQCCLSDTQLLIVGDMKKSVCCYSITDIFRKSFKDVMGIEVGNVHWIF